MGVTKSSLFTEDQNALAFYAKTFSHPARVAIIEYLLSEEKCINSNLVKELGLAQATISQHLRELKEIGIIQGTIEGVSVSYCINPSKWKEIKSTFQSIFSRFSCCSAEDCCN